MKFKVLTFILDHIRQFASTKYAVGSLITVFIIFILTATMPFTSNQIANMLFNNSNYSSAEKVWSLGSKLSLYDKDVLYANTGNALYRQDRKEQAIQSYESAIEIAPESRICKIKWNLVVSLVQLGKEKEVGEATEAISYYSRALFQLSYQPCLNNPEYQKTWQEMIEELEKRIESLNEELNKQRKNTYEVDPEFEKPSDQDRSNVRKDKLQRMKSNQEDEARRNLNSEELDQTFTKNWW